MEESDEETTIEEISIDHKTILVYKVDLDHLDTDEEKEVAIEKATAQLNHSDLPVDAHITIDRRNDIEIHNVIL